MLGLARIVNGRCEQSGEKFFSREKLFAEYATYHLILGIVLPFEVTPATI